MKKILSSALSLMLVVIMTISISVDAFAASASKDVWSVGWSDDNETFYGWNYEGKSKYSIDTTTYSGESRYSIKIKNTDYTFSRVDKTFMVEPNTTYKFSAMVKYSGYELSPTSEKKATGALIGYHGELSNYSKSKKWKKIEYIFTTNDETEYTLSLQNGEYNAMCKGTAWFSDIKLEKAECDNEWNILAVIFKNVDADVDVQGKKQSVKESLSDKQVSHIKRILKTMPERFETLSGGLMKVDNITTVTTKTPLTEFKSDVVDFDSETVKKILDKQLSKKTYNEILIFAPIDKFAISSAAAIGEYNGIHVVQLGYKYAFVDDIHGQGHIIHEMIHGMEVRSKKISPKTTPDLHSYADENITGEENLIKWYGKYMRSELKGGKGLNPSVFTVVNGYNLINSDMTVGGLIEIGSYLDISECEIEEISDKTYSGKKKAPKLTIKDGEYTLKKNVDYTVKYSNNKNVGKAKVTVTGKGIYKGTLTAEFNIIPKVTAKKNDNYITITWKGVKDAEKIVIWENKDGKGYEEKCVVDGTKTGKKIKCSKNHTYEYAITVYNPETGYTPYAHTKEINT